MPYLTRTQTSDRAKARFQLGPKHTLLPFQISIIITLVLLLIAVISQFILQPVVPIFYSLSSSINQIAPKAWLFLLPGLSILFNIVHIGSIQVFDLHRLVEKLYSWANLVLQIILLLITIRNILIIV